MSWSRSESRLPLLIALVTVAFSLRPALVSVSPLLEQIRASSDLSYTAASLLITIPVVGMGVFAFLAPYVTRVVGQRRGILYGVSLIGVATAIRIQADKVAILFASVIVVSIGIGFCQATLPAIVGEHFSDRSGFATGAYSTSMIVAATVASGLTVPIENLLGSWPLALAVWTLPALAALLVWFTAVGVDVDLAGSASAADIPAVGGLPWRDATAWLTVVYFTGQSVLFYSIITWVPTLFENQGMKPATAGFLLMLTFLPMIGSSFAFSTLADRLADRRVAYAIPPLLLCVGTLGLALVPLSSPVAWVISIGLGQGGMFSLSLNLPVDHAADADAAGRLTSMTIGIGYVVAAGGPFVLGAMRDLFGSFVVPFGALAAVSLAMAAVTVSFRETRVDSVV